MRRLFFLAVLGVAMTVSAIDQTTNNLIVPQSSSPQIVIPAAGSVQGAEGTFFRSEINILNYGSTAATLEFHWYPRPGEGVSGFTQTTLPAGSGIGSEDFVSQILGRQGLGAILIRAVNATGVDTTARIYASARIWTPQANNPAGTNSQTFNVIPLSAINSQRLALVGLRRGTQYRLNVGIVNLDPVNEQTFQITVGPRVPTEVTPLTVPAQRMQQINLPGDTQPGLQVHVENVTPSATRTNAWMAYGSSVDNVTGDSWSVMGFTPANFIP